MKIMRMNCKGIAGFAAVLFLAAACQAADGIRVLHTFTAGNDGSYPDGPLVADSAGNLYGTTQIGGSYGAGTVFKLTPSSDGEWKFSALHEFTGGDDGGNPLGGVVFDAAGNLYANTSAGGAEGWGAVFELTPQAGGLWKEKVLYSFKGGGDGAIPFGNLVFDAAGNLYGTTSIGGLRHVGCLAGCGTVYELTPASSGPWKKTVLHRFSDGIRQGAEPRAGLVFDAAGNLYGTTYEGGNNDYCDGGGCGSVFVLTSVGTDEWQFETLIDFDASNGAYPGGGLTLSSDAALYGTTLYGGTYNAGTIFSLTQQSGVWTFETIYNFNVFDGLEPSGNLALDGAGNIYGATYEGGKYDWGTIFQLVPGANGWSENLLYTAQVSGTPFGANPLGGVMLNGGNLYLTANQGGNLEYCQPNSGCGTVVAVSLAGN